VTFPQFRTEVEQLLGRRLIAWEVNRARNFFSYRYSASILVALIRSGRQR
jgi:hypothetical protein